MGNEGILYSRLRDYDISSIRHSSVRESSTHSSSRCTSTWRNTYQNSSSIYDKPWINARCKLTHYVDTSHHLTYVLPHTRVLFTLLFLWNWSNMETFEDIYSLSGEIDVWINVNIMPRTLWDSSRPYKYYIFAKHCKSIPNMQRRRIPTDISLKRTLL